MRTAALVVIGLLIFSSPCVAVADSIAISTAEISVGVEIVFSSEEVRIIRAHYSSQNGNHGKGKNKQKGLPPGIAKNLARGKPLPPGIAKKALPNELIILLPPVTDGYQRIVVAGQILLIEIDTQFVIDILSDAIL